MSEETITFNVVYTAVNIDESIRMTQRALLFTNALRLSIVDIQKVMSGPTISNVMWTAIQLTRVWTNLIRLVKAYNRQQQGGIAQGLIGGAVRGRAASRAAGAFSGAWAIGAGGELSAVGTAGMGLWASLTGFAAANPLVITGLAAGLIVQGTVAYDMRRRRRYNEWKDNQRNIARSQGLVY